MSRSPVQEAGGQLVVPAGAEDLELACRLFEEAMTFQRQRGYIGWTQYDPDFLRAEIERGFLYKVMSGGEVAAIFCHCYKDALIWRHLDHNDAIYLHRVVVAPRFRGGGWFGKIRDWASVLARHLNRRYLRIDTWAANEKLIGYYQTQGFRFVDTYTTPNDPALPVQHRNLHVALLEHEVEVAGNG